MTELVGGTVEYFVMGGGKADPSARTWRVLSFDGTDVTSKWEGRYYEGQKPDQIARKAARKWWDESKTTGNASVRVKIMETTQGHSRYKGTGERKVFVYRVTRTKATNPRPLEKSVYPSVKLSIGTLDVSTKDARDTIRKRRFAGALAQKAGGATPSDGDISALRSATESGKTKKVAIQNASKQIVPKWDYKTVSMNRGAPAASASSAAA